MTVAAPNARNDARVGVDPAVVADVVKVLARHDLRLSKTALAATTKVMAALSAATAQFSLELQKQIVADESELTHAVAAVVEKLATRGAKTLIDLTTAMPSIAPASGRSTRASSTGPSSSW